MQWPTHPVEMKVVVAGAGIAGNALMRQLLRRPNLQVRAYEQRSFEDASPPGLNVLMNHNGMEAIQECDPELYQAMIAVGSPCLNWSARTMDGQVLYHLEDVVQAGMANTPALLARWDLVHKATRTSDDYTEYDTKVVRVEKDATSGNHKLKVLLERRHQDGGPKEEWIHDVDYVIAADGRYSAIRDQLAPPVSYFGPPFIADFRIVSHLDASDPALATLDRLLPESAPIWRVYHQPQQKSVLESSIDCSDPQVAAAAAGIVRVGVMKLGPNVVGLFGNLRMESSEKLQTPVKQALVALFSPAEGEADDVGQLVLKILGENEAHWTRKQETNTCYTALDGRVLFVGDAAGAIYPSLGQGANLSLEDVCVTGALFPDTQKIAELRTPRREFIKLMSRRHAEHVADPEDYKREVNDWNNPSSEWRQYDLPRLWCGKALALRAVMATPENIAPFGQLIAESLDGDLYNPSTDAVLDLSKGIPRLYYMKLTGGRPLIVDRITCHKSVTQCLGALGTNEPFYLVIHEPSEQVTFAGLKAFCIPPRHFIKLNVGTWHVGPLWTGPDDTRTFINLELADTNEVDHTTVPFNTILPPVKTVDCPWPEANGELPPWQIPVYPVWEQ